MTTATVDGDLMDVATDQTHQAMEKAGWERTDNEAFPWRTTDGRMMTEQAARELFLSTEQQDKVEGQENGDGAKSPAKNPNPDPDAHALWEIFQAETNVREAEAELEEKKQEAKWAKTNYDEATKQLLKVIRKHRAPGERDLFDYANENTAPDVPEAQPVNEDAWRDTPLDDVFASMPASVLVSLSDKELTTLGQLSDWLNSGKRLIDLEGIGQAKAEKMELCMEKFWEQHKQSSPVSPDEEEDIDDLDEDCDEDE